MANFDPPEAHWAADFDSRLLSTFQWLRERVESLEKRVSELEKGEKARAEALAQAVSDMRFYAGGGK